MFLEINNFNRKVYEMIQKDIKRKKILQWVVLLFCTFICTLSFGENVLGMDLREQVFPVIGKGLDTKLAVGVTIGSYSKDTTLSAVRGMISALPEAERFKVPEYLLLKELDLAAQGDKQGIIALYATEEDKNFARNERWVDMAYSSSYIRDNVEGYTLKTKARFGPYVYIKYKPILKQGRSFGWSVVLKETENGYLFSRDLGKEHIFLLAVEAFPYWEDITVRNNAGDLSGFQVTRFRHKESSVPTSTNQDVLSPTVQLYYKLERFSEATSIDASQKEKIQNKLYHVLEGYKTGNPEEIVNSWDTSSRNKILKNLEDKTSMKATTEYFKDVGSIKPEYFIKSGDELFLYATPICISGERKVPKIFRFKLQENEYFLNDDLGKGNPYARQILRSKEFLAIIEGI
jgi:hypothetical protein